MKIYTIVCSYIFDADVINIELSQMLKRLNIEPIKLYDLRYGEIDGEYGIDYQIDKVIEYNVNHAYKVKYTTIIKKIKTKPGLFEYLNLREVVGFLNILNNKHDNMIMNMPKEEFEIKYKQYGNNYTKQIKKENGNESKNYKRT